MKKKLWILALSLFATLVLFDVALSLFVIQGDVFRRKPLPPYGVITDPRQYEWLEEVNKPVEERKNVGTFDRDLGWCVLPNKQSRNGHYTTTNLATRGQGEIPLAPDPARTRVVCFGDSFTWGEEVPDADSYPALLESLHAEYEVLNFGVGAYGTDQAFLRYRRDGVDKEGEVVVIGILLENIGRNVNYLRNRWSLTSSLIRIKPRFRLRGDGELELIPQPFATEADLLAAIEDGSVLTMAREHEYWGDPWVPTGKLSSMMRLFGAWQAFRARQTRRLWVDREGEPRLTTLAILEAFHAEALEDGARLAPVLVFPSEKELRGLRDEGDHYWAESLVGALEERGIPVIDLGPPLLEAYRREGRRLFSGYHLSRSGNTVVADTLAEWIQAR